MITIKNEIMSGKSYSYEEMIERDGLYTVNDTDFYNIIIVVSNEELFVINKPKKILSSIPGSHVWHKFTFSDYKGEIVFNGN